MGRLVMAEEVLVLPLQLRLEGIKKSNPDPREKTRRSGSKSLRKRFQITRIHTEQLQVERPTCFSNEKQKDETERSSPTEVLRKEKDFEVDDNWCFKFCIIYVNS